MEEEVGIKVTRLRRRLSVEADDVKSPSTQSTPTKKRGGRLAAKPQLELIDENATEAEKPKRTRKSLARDAEPEEKPVTPSRRSTRARSNTSIISDTPVEAEEKGTPARRSTRIKSNTSIVAETTQFADSPRAKRAARRTSQVGSDNETPITPARQTRRTRKDSTSSIDKQVEPTAGKLGTQIKEVITEESENKIKETTPKATPSKESKESPATRKSPRLNEKSGRKSSSLDNDNKENEPHTVKESKHNEGSEVVDGAVVSTTKKNDKVSEATEESNLSVSSSNLIKDLNSEPKKSKTNLNKTTSEADEPQTRSRRHRTKSWTTITSSPSHDNNFLSDTEAIKKKNKRKSNNLSGSGDGILNTSQSAQEIKEQDDIKEVSLNASTLSEKKKKKQLNKSVTLENSMAIEEISILNTSTKSDKSTIEADKSSNKNNVDDLKSLQKDDPNFTEKFFGKAPSGPIQSLVYIEDSDSNTGSIDKVNVNKEQESEDQCVPVVEHDLNDENNKESKNNLSFEPMDVDETMPENVSLSAFTEKNASGRLEENRKSLFNISQVNNVSVSSTNKSLRKSIALNQDDDNETKLNKSKRQSLVNTVNDAVNDSMNKSKRKSSASVIDTDDNKGDDSNQANNQMEFEESMNKSLSKSKRKSSIANADNDDMDINSSSADVENDETENKSANKSKRKSSIGNVDEANSNEKLNKSKRKSSISNIVNDSDNNSSITNTDDDAKSTNKSKRKSSISNIANDTDNNSSITNTDDDAKSTNKSKRKSSISNIVNDTDNNSSITNTDDDAMSTNKSKRKSSIAKIVDDIDKNSSITNTDDDVKSTNKSKRKSSISNVDVDNKADNKSMNADVGEDNKSISNTLKEDNVDSGINQSSNDNTDYKSSNKSIRKSTTNAESNDSELKDADKSKRTSVSMVTDTDEVDSSINKSKRKSSIGNIEDDIVNKSSNKSKRKSSISNAVSENNLDSSINKSKRKSTINVENDTIVDGIANKSKRQSSISDNDNKLNKSTNKSKRKSSISQMESQSFDKSSNENKSTLVLSQIKDISETTAAKDIYEFNESIDTNEKLSKSANVPNVNKDNEADKKNLSLTYSTSTPLQQKSMKKLGMQINTSIIAPNSATKTEKNVLNRSKKHASVLSQNDEESEPSDDEDEDDEDAEEEEEEEEDSEEENESLDKSKMIDDEAEEASDDYESGDSRDEDEKDYEAQHEIVEKGETLDSDEEDFSDDSDYERDSFIVDSDEEDNELLSGSGDDLSMSDNELNMSAKSKKKFNERKVKEQKKASREMFEARHKINESGKSSKSDKPKSKKGNRQQLESSESESDGEVSVQPKKNRRARIDSSQDLSQNQSDADKSIVSKKKKKVKRLSESVCEDATNEKEISIQKSNDTEKEDDPLSLQNVVKKEPKTPQKDLNISTVAITNIEEVEEVQLDGNVSILKMNQTSDPLQTTVAQDDAMEDDSDESISENEEIAQNYESVLNDLNKKSKKIKSQDVSLNLGKKTKQKTKEPIVDQLNLTQVKKSKKKITTKENSEEEIDKDLKTLTNNIIAKVNKSVIVQDEGSSDSIDMKLLFNDDSTDGEINLATGKEKDSKEVVEDFIPLKRTEGKTNILESTDVTSSSKNDSILNVSKSKKNKRKSSQPEETSTMNGEANENISFFIDTTGTHADLNTSVANTSVKDSAKKSKQKNNVSSANIEKAENDDDSNDAPLEVSYHSEKNNKSKQDLNSTQTEAIINTTINETPGQSAKKKKKNKKGLNNSQINVEDTGAADKSLNASILNVTGGNKKKKSLSESHVEQNTEETKAEPAHNISVGSAKKQKKKTLSESAVVEKVTEEEIRVDTAHNVSIGSAKKQKKKSISESFTVENVCEEEARVDSAHNVSIGSAKKLKKKTVSENSADQPEKAVKDDTTTNEDNSSKKRKRKPSANPSFDESIVKDNAKVLNTSKSLNESTVTTNKKKKRKIVHNDEKDTPQSEDAVPQIQLKEENPVGKKAKKKNKTVEVPESAENSHETVNKNKKRKVRADDDDDDGDKSSKVTKQNSTDKVYVPRLPANILKQLDDKPKRDIDTKTKVTSTTSFMVEATKKRRAKPSNYLEQSVYLNDSMEEQTKKSQLKKPKVLPFIPTASTSNYGFTTNFRVNIIPQETQFVAQSSDVSNFKKDCLQKNRIKKLGTFEMYKRHRNIKISKF